MLSIPLIYIFIGSDFGAPIYMPWTGVSKLLVLFFTLQWKRIYVRLLAPMSFTLIATLVCQANHMVTSVLRSSVYNKKKNLQLVKLFCSA